MYNDAHLEVGGGSSRIRSSRSSIVSCTGQRGASETLSQGRKTKCNSIDLEELITFNPSNSHCREKFNEDEDHLMMYASVSMRMSY